VILFDAQGREALGRVTSILPDEILLEIEGPGPADPPSPAIPTKIEIACAWPKQRAAGILVQKCGELGVDRLIPLETSRGVVRIPPPRLRAHRERWQRVAVEAAKQSGRARPTEIVSPRTLDELLGDASTVTIALDPAGEPLRRILEALAPARPILLLVGPEGGWSAAEQVLLRERRVPSATLGPHPLRVETAAIVAVSQVLYHRCEEKASECPL
jgi:16S rRNA (uracil1498-N3)-methyltransferase